MLGVKTASLPDGALLGPYTRSGAYTDCFSVTLARPASLPEFMSAFYTSPIFKLERWLLARFARLRSSDAEALLLAQGQLSRFAAWHVEARQSDQALLAAGRTRSWLMVAPAGEQTALFFGSAVVPRKHGGLGWAFTALLGFHKLYSRILLAAALRQLVKA